MNPSLKLFDSISALNAPKMCVAASTCSTAKSPGSLVFAIVSRKIDLQTRPDALHSESPVSGGEPKSGHRSLHNEELNRHYKLIGETLLIAEVGALQAGIPWLPPTARRRALRSRYDAPLKEFIRYSLVGVQTSVLEAYCEDLESSILPDQTRNRPAELGLDPLTSWERYSFSALLGAAVFVFLFSAALVLGVDTSTAAALSIATSLLSCGSAYILSQEEQRRVSFHRILYREIMRRRGLDEPNGNRIRVMSVEPN